MKYIACLPAALAAALGCLLGALPASAQQVYRIVGPDGRISFTDQPPPDARAQATATAPATGQAPGTGGTLPFELRQAASRFPVTLYTGPNCAPCDQGRALLVQRGIPFAQRTVSTPEDGEALRRLSGELSLPLLTVGSQQVRGFAPGPWSQYLDAAGYPARSMLPAGYRQAAAIPLAPAAPQAAVTAAAPSAEGPRTSPPIARTTPSQGRGPNPANPAGIQF